MFDGVPDQFHQFIASSRASLQIPFPFPLHATTSPPPPPLAPTFPTFDPYPSHQTLQPHHHHHHLHHHLSSPPPPPQPKNEASKEDQTTTLLSTSLVLERERSSSSSGEPGGPWSNEEVLALLRIRSSMENWFPDYSWEHVSRKLAEVGFKRSPEKCKERFEEESRNLNSLSFNKNSFRFFMSELDELYQHQQGGDHKNHQNEESVDTRNNNQPPALRREAATAAAAQAQSLEEGSGNVDHNSTTSRSSKSNNNGGDDEKKRKKKKKGKRKREFEMFKGFCEGIVERIMAQQEELHSKIIEDMVKREEEKIARDEAWKSQERDRLNKEIETREKEHEIASNRQAKIIELLNKFASSSPSSLHSPLDQSLFDKFNDLFDPPNNPKNLPTTPSSTHPHNEIMAGTKKTKKVSPSSSFPLQNPTSNPTQTSTNPSFTSPKVPTETLILPSTETMDLAPENHPTPQSKDTQLEPTQNGGGGDIGKRWPREEVLALINLRCSLNNNSDNNNNSKDGAKGPLWERISQGMQELGYNRSAKRCKEKWENINKYFRKTKDNNKKRSLDSRTCPYFHQLSSLYSQRKLRGDSPENRSAD